MLASQEALTEADRTFLTELQETVRSATDEEQFSQIVTLMQNAKHQAMNTADIPAVVHTAGRDFGITDTEQNGVLQRLIESDDLSLYGLANAVTRHSQDVESYSDMVVSSLKQEKRCRTKWNCTAQAANY